MAQVVNPHVGNEAEAARKEATFADLAAAYMERHARPNKRSAWQDENTLRRYIPVGWNSRRLSDIARADVARLHAKIGEAHGHYAANRTLALLRTMFNLARVWELFKSENPAQGIKQFREQRRERYLSPDELAAVNRALLEEPDWRWRAYFPLALMLGIRKSELLAMCWQDIDLNARTWRIPETKTGNSHLLPLPAPVMAMLESLPSRFGASEWVFPGDGATGHIVEPAKAWQRVRAGKEV
jgi:integrase